MPARAREDLTGRRAPGRLCSVGKLLAVVLGVLVAVEVIAVIGVAGALFWVGGRGTMTVGATMLMVTLVAGVLALRAARPPR
jgi:hypothetical protein